MEKRITELSEKYIFNETIGSFLLIMLSHIEQRTKERVFEESYKVDKDILDIKTKIKNYLLSMETVLSDSEVRKDALNECFVMKKELIGIYEIIYRYFAKFNILSNMVSDEISLRKYKEDPAAKDKKIEHNIFLNDCMEFLQSAESETQFRHFVGELFECVPLKMTREKYFGLIETSLEEAFGEVSEAELDFSIESFKNACAPEMSEGYGKYFSDIADFLKEHSKVKVSELSDEELDDELEEMNTVLEVLNDIEDYCQEILNDVNSLIIIFYMGYTIDEMSEDNYGYKDVYYKVCEVLKEDGESAFDDTLTEMLEEYIEPVLDMANALNKDIMKNLEKVQDFNKLSEDTVKTLSTEAFVRSCFYDDLNEEIFNYTPSEDETLVSYAVLKEKINSFIKYMKEYLVSLPNATRKASVQKLLGSLPLWFDVHSLLDYIRNGVNEADSFEHSMLILDKVGMVFARNGFNYQVDEEEHEHSHDCGCDHHHHH